MNNRKAAEAGRPINWAEKANKLHIELCGECCHDITFEQKIVKYFKRVRSVPAKKRKHRHRYDRLVWIGQFTDGYQCKCGKEKPK